MSVGRGTAPRAGWPSERPRARSADRRPDPARPRRRTRADRCPPPRPPRPSGRASGLPGRRPWCAAGTVRGAGAAPGGMPPRPRARSSPPPRPAHPTARRSRCPPRSDGLTSAWASPASNTGPSAIGGRPVDNGSRWARSDSGSGSASGNSSRRPASRSVPAHRTTVQRLAVADVGRAVADREAPRVRRPAAAAHREQLVSRCPGGSGA